MMTASLDVGKNPWEPWNPLLRGVCVGKLGDLWTCFFFLFFFLTFFKQICHALISLFEKKWLHTHQSDAASKKRIPSCSVCVFLNMFSWCSYLSYLGRVFLAAVFVVFLTPQVLEPVGLSCEWRIRFDLTSRYDPPIYDRKVLIKFWWDGWERLKQQVFCFWS